MLQLLLALATAAGPVPAAKWRFETSVSKMDDSKTVLATLPSNDQLQLWPAKVYRPSLLMRCQEGQLRTFFDIGGPLTTDTSRGGSYIMLRVDKLPAESWPGDRSTTGTALFVDYAWLVPRLATGKTFLLRVTPLNSVPQDVSFDLRGFEEVFAVVAAACNMPTLQQLRESAAAQQKAEVERAQAAAEAEVRAKAEALAAAWRQVEQGVGAPRAFDRARAAQAAAQFGGEYVPQLVGLLRDPEWDVRSAAARALGDIGAPAASAIEALEKVASDSSLGIQQSANDAAGKIRKASAQ